MFTPEQREAAKAKVLDGLSLGIPLAVICREEGMPCDDTIRAWADRDEELSRAIARVRLMGWDVLAAQCLEIADTQELGVIRTVKADGTVEQREEDMLGHRKLRIETRLKLLAKWDPKRYGDRQLIGSDPENPLPPGFAVHFMKPDGASEG